MGGLRTWLGVVAAGALVSLGASALVPADANAALVICQKKKRIKIRQDACTPKETQVDAAELGVTGPQGPAGLGGVEVVTADGNVIIDFSGVSSATASCPEGKVVLGGGVTMGNVFGSVTSQSVRASAPVTTAPQGWYGELEADVTDDWQARVYAVCANAAP